VTLLASVVLLAVLGPQPLADPPTCAIARITGYNRTAPYFSSHTYDGTPILTPEPIVAASMDVPLGSYLVIDGPLTEGTTYRVADRGSGLHPTHIDVAVWSDEEAFALTSTRRTCWSTPRR
jgi:3D (Asp-Asp-Asp) domain-containing protein